MGDGSIPIPHGFALLHRTGLTARHAAHHVLHPGDNRHDESKDAQGSASGTKLDPAEITSDHVSVVHADEGGNGSDEEEGADRPLHDAAWENTNRLFLGKKSHRKERKEGSGEQCTGKTVSRRLGRMKISRDWLSDFVDWIETDPQVIADRITCGVGEVDDVVLQGKYLDGVVVGTVRNLAKHPNADKLSVCDIETEQGLKHVVCGGTNLREGMQVAFAHVGTTVLAGGKEELTLAKVKIRSVESEGMICAAEEIELSSMFPASPEDGARPIADLTSRGFKTGTPLRTALGMNDVVFHIDNHAITNRPDLFSHIGVAREVVALGLAKWKKQPKSMPMKFGTAAPGFTLKNDAPDLVPDYTACVIDIDGEGTTPDWMKRRLEATGWRSINLVVDITNYVLMEVGMPLHAFDADDFRGTLHIRKAKKGETITTLDGVKRELPEGAVVISDDEGIFDLFGVMGGLRTSNKPTTKRIFLQAGIIQPVSVRKTVIAMGHRTDAATVYEKGVNLSTAKRGLARAAELFRTLHPKAAVVSKEVQWGSVKAKKAITIDAEVFAETTGADISVAQAKSILTDLGFAVKAAGKKMTVTPPEWRNDVTGKHDLVEEVSRIYGYGKIPVTMPKASIVPPERDERINVIRDALKERGLYELLHLAFTSPGAMKKAGLNVADAAKIENPIGEEVSLMRTSLLPSILETLGHETPRFDASALKVFEYGRVFRGKVQPFELCIAVAAKSKVTLGTEPLLTVKADLTAAMLACGYALEFRKSSGALPPFAHAGRSADIVCEGTVVGLLTEIEPSTAKNFDLQNRIAAAIVDLEALKLIAPKTVIAKPLPSFPGVEFDETLPLPKTPYAAVITKLRGLSPLLTELKTVNLYDGNGVRTVTLRFTYRAADRTLTQEEVEKEHAKVVAELRKS